MTNNQSTMMTDNNNNDDNDNDNHQHNDLDLNSNDDDYKDIMEQGFSVVMGGMSPDDEEDPYPCDEDKEEHDNLYDEHNDLSAPPSPYSTTRSRSPSTPRRQKRRNSSITSRYASGSSTYNNSASSTAFFDEEGVLSTYSGSDDGGGVVFGSVAVLPEEEEPEAHGNNNNKETDPQLGDTNSPQPNNPTTPSGNTTNASVATTSAASSCSSSVDYRGERASRRRLKHHVVDAAPPLVEAKFLPPPKYKLWLVVLFCQYMAEWLAYEARVGHFLEDMCLLSHNAALFVWTAFTTAVLVYGALETLVVLAQVKNCWAASDASNHSKWVGLASWLQQDRAQWARAPSIQDRNLICQVWAGLVVLLEDGLAMLNAPPQQDNSTDPTLPVGRFVSLPHLSSSRNNNYHRTNKSIVLRMEHRIPQEKEEAYLEWKDELLLKQVCRDCPGLLAVQSQTFQGSGQAGHLYVVYMKFATLDDLNAYLVSPVRFRALQAIQPLLAVPDPSQLRRSRTLPDAWSDLCTPQGHTLGRRPPKKYKVWWLVTLALFVTSLVVQATLLSDDSLGQVWGLDNEDHDDDTSTTIQRHAQRFVQVLLVTGFTTYVSLPLVTSALPLGVWIQRVPRDGQAREPWRTLTCGFKQVRVKMVLALSFYGTLVALWMWEMLGQ